VRARATVAVGTGRAAQATAKEPKRRDGLKLCAYDRGREGRGVHVGKVGWEGVGDVQGRLIVGA
jgi:hypothetical protein